MFNNEPIEQSVSLLKHRPKRRGETKEPLPADIRAKAVYYFRHSYHQSMIITSMSFSLRCNNNLTKLIYERFPMADLFWEFNSQPLRVDPSRTSYKPLVNEMTILVAGPEDSGVYACKMAQNWYWDQIVEIFVVQVQSFMPTITSRERELMTLSCNSEALYELYSTINKTWRHNGEVIFTGTGAEGDGLTLHHTKAIHPSHKEGREIFQAGYLKLKFKIKRTDGGVWECTVANSGRTWLISRVNVSVLPPVSLWESMLSQPRFMIGAAGLVCTGCVVFFFTCFGLAYWSDKRDHEESLYFAEQLRLMKNDKET